MSLIKCPRCELNYMNDTDKMCSVCRREVRGESEQFEMLEMCSECGENPAVPGQELCASCLKERSVRTLSTDDTMEPGANATLELDSTVSGMDEIELDLHGGLEDEVFDEEDAAEFADEEDEDDDFEDEDE